MGTCNVLAFIPASLGGQIRSAYGVWDEGGEVRPFTGVGQLDPKTGRVRLIAHSYAAKSPGRPAGARDAPWMSFNYIGDETQTLSCSSTLLLSNHQGYLGSLDLSNGRLANLYGKRDTYGGFLRTWHLRLGARGRASQGAVCGATLWNRQRMAWTRSRHGFGG